MGKGGFRESDWRDYKTKKRIDYAKTAHDIYNTGSSGVKADWLPYNVIRESCNSEEHPDSTPIILGLDVTGSMDRILTLAAKRAGDAMVEIIERKCVPHPQILFAAVDDYITSGRKCLQVTQFESDIRIVKQMYELSFIERGGSNEWESYADVWYFAKHHTKCDAIAKGRKGIIITMGDDGLQPDITPGEINEVFGDVVPRPINTKQLLNQVNRDWEIFHISMAQGSNYGTDIKKVWDEYLGERHIVLKDVEKLPEVIVSLLQTIKGDTVEEIAQTWDNSTALVIKDALGRLSVGNNKNDVVVF